MGINRDLYDNLAPVATTYPVAIAANKAKDVGVAVTGFDSVMFHVQAGAIVAAGLVTPVAQECDTLGGTYTDVAAADLRGAFVAMIQNDLQKVGYIGSKPFVAVRFAYTSGTSIVAGASVVRGHPSLRPVPNIA